jgi:two-component system, sensor histidine kinase
MTQGENGASGEITDPSSSALVPLLWAQANHDLRQPLQALFFMTRSLARSLEEPKHQETVTYMELALKGLQKKLDMLTELSRIETGLKIPELSPCPLAETYEALLPAMNAIAVAHGIRLRSRIARVTVLSDATLLTTVIKSLLLHALKLSNRSDVLVGSRRRADKFSLEIYFKGAPLSEAHQRGAFVQIAVQKDEPSASELGLGLGFIAHLCRALNHAIECTPLPRGGMRLALTLPPTVA